MAAAHKAGDGLRFTVRPFRAGDSPEARRIFSEGQLDQPLPAFRRALRSPAAPCLLLPAGAAVYVVSWSLAWAALSVAALLALLYLACRMFYTNYLRETLVAAQEFEGQPGCCQLLRLTVDRRCRGLGLGRRLTCRVLEFARDSGYRECLLYTNTGQQPAIRLYQAQGFRVTRDMVPLPGLALLSWVTHIYLCEMRFYPLNTGNYH